MDHIEQLEFVTRFIAHVEKEFGCSEEDFAHFSDYWNAAAVDVKAIGEMTKAVGKVVAIDQHRWLADDDKPGITWLEDKTMVLVDEEGGGEGEGEYCHKVAAIVEKVTETTVKILGFVKTVGWYASYDGSHYEDGWKVTEPREVMVVEWK